MLPSPLRRKARAAVARSHSIDQQLDEARLRRQKEVQLLILGSAGTGKSTFLKQLRILHGDGFPVEERQRATPTVIENTCEAMIALIHNMQPLGIAFDNPEMERLSRELEQNFSTLQSKNKNSDCLRLVVLLMESPAVHECFRRRDEYELSPSDCHFLQNVDRISSPNYIPTHQDLLFIRKPTLGIQEYTFNYNELIFRVIDVAGQRNHRKKWLHLFDCVTAITFFSSLTSFCETLEEDPSINALHDSLQLFEDLVSNRFLKETAFILFLNKNDLLSRKLQKHELSVCFPHYTGPNDVTNCVEFIKSEFMKRKPKERELYVHTSCAVDMGLMKTLVDSVMEVVVENNLRKAKAF